MSDILHETESLCPVCTSLPVTGVQSRLEHTGQTPLHTGTM